MAISIELESKVEKFRKDMALAEKALKGMETQGKSTAGGYVDASGKMRDANGRFVKSANQASKAARDLAAATDEAARSAKTLDDVAMPLAGAFASLSLGAAVAIKTFGDFEAVLNEFKAVSGATADEMARIKQQAQELGSATKFSAKETAQAQAELAKSGMNVNQVISATPGVLSLAAAGQLDVARAAEITGAALNGFGLAADQAGRVADLLAVAANASALDVNDVGESLKYAATIASSTSQDIEEVATALAILGNAGIKGSQGGTVFRASMASLAKPSEEAAKIMADMSLAIEDASGKMLPFTVIMGQLREKTANMTEVQRAHAVATIFGTEAMSGVLAVMKQTPAQVNEVATAFSNVTGESERVAATMNSGLKGSLEQLGGAAETATTAVGEGLAPAITLVANQMQEGLEAFNKMEPGLKNLATGAFVASAAFTGLGAAAGGLSVGIGALGGAAGLAALATNPLTLSIAALAAVVGIATASIKATADAQAEATKKEEEARKARLDSTRQAKTQKDELEKLSKEYNTLAGKASLSKDEQIRLKAIQDKLKTDYPDLAKKIEAAGGKHKRVADLVRDEIQAKKELIEHNKALARWSALSAQKELEAESTKLAELKKQRAELGQQFDGSNGGPVGIAAAGQLNALNGQIASQQRVVETLAKRTMNAVMESAKTLAIADPVAPKKTAGTPTGGTGGGTVDEKAAKELHQERLARIRDLTTATERLTEVQKASGEDTELKNLQALYQAIRKELGGTTEGAEVLAKIQHRINVLLAEQARKAKELADAEANRKINNQHNDMEEWFEAQAEAARKASEEVSKLIADNDAAVKAFSSGVKEMQGDLTALALDPSMERIANFARDLASDEEKMKRWGKTLAEVGAAFRMAGGNLNTIQDYANGVNRAVGMVADNVNTAALSTNAVVGALAVQFAVVKNLFDGIVGPMERAKERAASFADEMARINEELAGGGLSNADAASQRLRALSDRLADLQERLRELRGDNEGMNPLVAWFGLPARIKEMLDAEAELPERKQEVRTQSAVVRAGSFSGAIQNIQSRKDLGLITADEAAQARLDAARSSLEDWIKVRDEATDPADRSQAQGFIDRLVPMVESFQKVVDGIESAKEAAEEAEKKAIAMAKQQAELGKEIRDLAQQRADHEARVAELLQRQADLKKQIADVDRKEREALAGLSREGIATRAETEAQYKTRRRGEITSEAATERSALQAALEAARRQAEYERRQAEIASQNAIMARKAQGYRGPGLAPGSTAANASGDGSTVVWDGTKWNRAPKYHTGIDRVPGARGQEVPAILEAGERVQTEWQARATDLALQMASMRPQAVGGGTSVGDIHLTIQAQTNADPLAIADIVEKRVTKVIRYATGGK